MILREYSLEKIGCRIKQILTRLESLYIAEKQIVYKVKLSYWSIRVVKKKELVEQYKKLQVEAYDQISRLKEQGLSDDDELVREYTEMWRNAYKSMKDMQKNLTADRINDIEHQIYLLDKSIEYSGEENTTGKPNSQVIAQYEQLMQIAQEEMSKLFLQGFTENDTEVQEWQKRWYSYYDSVVQAGENAYKEMQSAEQEALKNDVR